MIFGDQLVPLRQGDEVGAVVWNCSDLFALHRPFMRLKADDSRQSKCRGREILFLGSHSSGRRASAHAFARSRTACFCMLSLTRSKRLSRLNSSRGSPFTPISSAITCNPLTRRDRTLVASGTPKCSINGVSLATSSCKPGSVRFPRDKLTPRDFSRRDTSLRCFARSFESDSLIATINLHLGCKQEVMQDGKNESQPGLTK